MNLLTSANQTVFIKDKFIFESVVSAHEVIHAVNHNKEKGDVLKLDYEKAFDKVNLDFLDELLIKRYFSPTFRNFIRLITRGGSVSVKVNGVEGNSFTTWKGLKKGDPLSSLLFNFVVDVFTHILNKVASHNLIRELCLHHIPGGVISLQYADDTILFIENNLEMAKNLKWVLTSFEQVSGMKVNYNKSELVPINLDPKEILGFKEDFDCVVGSFPIKYLGGPLHHEKFKREDFQPIIYKILKRIAGWRGKLLSYEARVLLVKACLASIPVYLLAFLKFPKWALKLINTQMANCLWSDTKDKNKLHLASWHLVCMPKSQGGLGIPCLRDVNICLLASSLKR
jgi:hypothetical protein